LNRGVKAGSGTPRDPLRVAVLALLATLDALTSCFLRVARVSLRPPPAFTPRF